MGEVVGIDADAVAADEARPVGLEGAAVCQFALSRRELFDVKSVIELGENGEMIRHIFLGVGALAAIAIFGAGEVRADKVGVAAAVNPDAFSSLSGAPHSQLNIGKSIFFNERINTTTSGLVQVLLVDGSTFTVGPGSDLVIDKFIYDAKKGTGQITASFSKGVMRFVGGKISKNDNAVSIKTPAGAIAVRGCIVMTEVTSSSFAAVLVYGDYLKMKDLVVFEAGNGIFLQNGQMVIKPTPPGVINGMLAGLTNKGGGGFAGGQGNTGNPGPTFQLVTTESMNELISDANTTQIVDQAQNQVVDQAQNQAVTQETTPTIPENTAPPCESECEGSPAGHQWGYAGGLYVQNESEVYVQDEGENDYSNEGGDDRVGVLSNWKAKEVDLTFNDGEQPDVEPGSFTSAAFALHVGQPGQTEDRGGAEINFGGSEHTSVNQYGFAALAPPDGIKIFHDDDTEAEIVGDPEAVLVSSGFFGGFRNNSENLSHGLETNVSDTPDSHDVVVPPLCNDCDFMRWGAFAAEVSFKDTRDDGRPVQRDVTVFGWWVSGDVPAVGELPFQGNADYWGNAVATVSYNSYDLESRATHTWPLATCI